MPSSSSSLQYDFHDEKGFEVPVNSSGWVDFNDTNSAFHPSENASAAQPTTTTATTTTLWKYGVPSWDGTEISSDYGAREPTQDNKQDDDNDDDDDDGANWVSLFCCYVRLALVQCCIIIAIALFMFIFGLLAGDKLGLNIFSSKSSDDTSSQQINDFSDLTYYPSAATTNTPTTSPTLRSYPTDHPTLSPSTSPTATIKPTSSPTYAPTFLAPPPSNITVGAYYYPWHGDDFHKGNYLREKLTPRQWPQLGEYDDTQPEVVAQHLQWSRQANIKLWITSWWGQGRREDETTKNVILQHQDLGDHKIALFYETTGRIKTEEDMDTNIVADISYICETYFVHPNYLYLSGRPVLFVYITRKLDDQGLMEQVVLLMRSVASNYGHDIWIVGDHVWKDAPPTGELFKPFLYLDGVTNYDVYGSMAATGYAGQPAVQAYYREQYNWKLRSNQDKCAFLPAVSPGFNDRGVRLQADHKPLSRRLTPDSPEGSLFAAALEHAVKLVDETAGNLLIVNSFNEWHEDSQVEPVAAGPTASQPSELTGGLQYEGYGDLYLRILRNATVDDLESQGYANFPK